MARKNLHDFPPAIILGRPNANLLGQVRALGRQGIEVYCLLTRGEPPFIARLSRYVDHTIIVQHAADDEIVAAIKEIREVSFSPPVVFWGGDYDIALVARIWPRISKWVTAVTPPREAARFNDKECQIQRVLAEGQGVATPKTLVLYSEKDVDNVATQLEFPVICRPVELARKGQFDGKMFIAGDDQSLRAKLAPVFTGRASGEILVQEYIKGGSDQLFFALASCGDDGCPVAMVTGRKLYEYPDGLMCVGETVDNSRLYSLAEKVFSAFALSGVLGVEFKYDSCRDDYYFIEVNFRPENILSIAERSGVNIMYHAYLKAIGRLEMYPADCVQNTVVWRDISLVVLSRLSGRNPPDYRTKGRESVDAYWSFSDPLPAIAWYIVKVWRVLKGLIRGRNSVRVA